MPLKNYGASAYTVHLGKTDISDGLAPGSDSITFPEVATTEVEYPATGDKQMAWKTNVKGGDMVLKYIQSSPIYLYLEDILNATLSEDEGDIRDAEAAIGETMIVRRKADGRVWTCKNPILRMGPLGPTTGSQSPPSRDFTFTCASVRVTNKGTETYPQI